MHKVQILLTEQVTHDTKRFIVEKPDNYKFTPGQATEVAINLPEWENQKRPFTFTSVNEDKVLEFVIKGYDPKDHSDHDGMTHKLHTLKPGNELLIDDPWGTIEYKGTGVFVAAGAGITPFIAIFKDLASRGELSGNKLIYANKTLYDIILFNQLHTWFPEDDLLLTLSREERPGYKNGRVDKNLLKEYVADFNTHWYLCGPPPFVKGLREVLESEGASADDVTFEK